MQNNNGWLATVALFAAEKLGMGRDEAVWLSSLNYILLLRREHVFESSDKPGIQLSTMDWLDEQDGISK